MAVHKHLNLKLIWDELRPRIDAVLNEQPTDLFAEVVEAIRNDEGTDAGTDPAE